MIVRNEADLLAQCLESIAALVDEIVVCDTGSVDDTLSIAEAAGATVLTTTWNDDFGRARNVALDAARHGRYVMWIDADERLVCDDPTMVRTLLDAGTGAQTLAIEIESVRDDSPTSIGQGTRLFRPDGLHFEGALHERLVREDGAEPTVEPFDQIRISHLGYDAAVVDQDDKAERNVRIARSQYEAKRSAKAALDLARALANAAQHPTEVLAVVESGLDGLDTSHHAFLPLMTIRAELLFKTDAYEEAFDTAGEILASDTGNDVASAVLARAATELGRFGELVAHAGWFEPASGTRSTTVPANLALAQALTAGAHARLGDIKKASLAAKKCLESLPSRVQAFEILVDGLSGVEPQTSAQILTSVGGDDTASLLSDIIDRARTNDSSPDNDAPTDALGITLDFDIGDAFDPGLAIAEALPPGRRVLDMSRLADLASMLEIRGHRVRVSNEPGSDPSHGRFDVVVIDPKLVVDEDIVVRAVALLDPSGMLTTWLDDGLSRSEVEAQLASAGLMSASSLATDLVSMRPVWTEGTLAALTTEEDASTRLFVSSAGSPTPDQMVALRASLPSDVRIVALDDPDPMAGAGPAGARDEDLVLVLAPGLVPEPGWVQTIWDSARASTAAVGCRVVDPSGMTIHAGSVRGVPLAVGELPATPLLASNRFDVELVAPYVCPVADLAATTRGQLLGDVAAVTLESSPDSPVGTGLHDLFPRTAVFLGGGAPGHNHPDLDESLEKSFDRLISNGVTPVYQWRDHAEAMVDVLARWRRSGVVLLSPPAAAAGAQPRPDAVRPQAAALVQALAPTCVVYLSADSLASDFRPASGEAAGATIAYAGHQSIGELESRLDISCTPNELPDRIADMVEMTNEAPTASIRTVEAIEATTGLTSIVIPVFNRWDLTKACLDSLGRHTPRPIEVIVVNNGSSDETADKLSARTDVRVITNRENLGFPAAVNQGIVASTGEFVCVLNNDTAVTSGWLESLHASLGIDGTGAVGPRTNQIGGLQIVPGALPPSEGKKANRWAREWTRVRKGRTWTTNRLVGFCLLAGRSTFELLGGFDESFGIGNYEDDEFGRRVQQAGFTLRVADDAFVLHHGSATFISMNIDHTASSHAAARNLAHRQLTTLAGTTALILSDGDSKGASVSAATALLVADRVRIAERSAVASTQLATAAIGNGLIEVVPGDWTTDAGASAAMEGLDERLVIVIEAGEQVVTDDWGAARSELDAMSPGPIEVGVSAGAEVRIVPPGPTSVRMVGAHSPHSVEHFSLRRTVTSPDA